MRQKLVAGNWKMHGSLQSNQALLAQLREHLDVKLSAQRALLEVLVCVPAPYLAQVESLLNDSPIAWGAQNVSQHKSGAYTGETSVNMLQDFGCSHVLVGHSERRGMYEETDFIVAAKFQAVRAAGLTPVLCVGETLRERESGVTEAVIARQIDAVLEVSGIDGFRQAIVAYEPVWAIGTGKTASPEQAQAVHAYIRHRLSQHHIELAGQLRIVYGGSVKADNAAELFAMPDIDGGLVGGASLVPAEFIAICEAACS
jgi:triosephosphate isomerase